jgi:hypothetical protein
MKRTLKVFFVFVASLAVSIVPIAMLLTILNLYLSGNGIIDISVAYAWDEMSIANLLFIMLTLMCGGVGAVLYASISKK